MPSHPFFPRIANGLLMAMTLSPLLPAALGAGYSDAVLVDKPLAYYRFNDSTQRSNINVNSGSLGPAGNATNLNLHLFSGAIAGSRNPSAYLDSTARTIVPWNAALNPNATNNFTIEAWFYPTSDKVAGSFTGPAPLNNRYSYPGVDRQGWVYFQRNPDASYAPDGQSDVGWNFRMYIGSGSSVGVQLTSQVPYHLGQWQHVVTVWEGSSQTATMFIDGQPAATNTWAGDGAGYVANTGDHPPTEAVNGPAGLSVGSYNNTEPGSNPFRGAVDEVAFYAKALSAAQILAHYQNATNSARTTAYESMIKSDGPVGYWRLDDPLGGPDVAVNIGLLQNSGMATNIGQVQHPATAALSDPNDRSYGYHWRNNGKATTDVPFLPEHNPDATVPFSLEAWLRPLNDQQNPGPSPMNNRLAGDAVNRTGWVIYQRAPNDSYSTVSGFEGVGWDFRMYTGSGHNGQDVVSNLPYQVGQWQHVVVTWDGTNTATMFIDGNPAATNTAVTYAANTNPPASPDDALPPADLAIGSYNAASGFGEEFEGQIDEVAFYTNVLSAAQVLAHYQAGTNSHPAATYASLVLSAPYDNAGTQALQPVSYFRFNDPALAPATNSGSLGDAANAAILATVNSTPGPQPPAFTGFDAGNSAVPLDGTVGWVSLNNPPGLNVTGQITLESWIRPAATAQGDSALIISHGPATPSSYTADTVETNGVLATPAQVFLGLKDKGANYAVGTTDGTNFNGANISVPAGDLGGDKWIHLVGTFDGANWKLYRNGTAVATAADTDGALPVPDGDWAIGGTGMGWADLFNGSIDDVAIYDHALKPERIQAHYAAATAASAAPSLGISVAGGKIILTWPSGTLQSASLVTGPFKDVPGATSPYTVVPAASTAQFYILRQ